MFGFLIFGNSYNPFFHESLPPPYKYFLWTMIFGMISLVLTFFITKYVIQPRTGVVKPGSFQKSIRKKMIIIRSVQIVISIIFIIILITGISSGIQISGVISILIAGLLFMPLFVIMAYLLKYPRLYLIASLEWLAIIINELLFDSMNSTIRWFLSFGIMGGVIFLMGLIIFIRFLKRYPLLKEERT